MSTFPLALTPQDFLDLRRAQEHLEQPSFAVRLTNVMGTPIEMGLKLLPRMWWRVLHEAVERAIGQALKVAAGSLRGKQGKASNTLHKAMGMAAGAVGGFFGGPALVAELPVTTTLMLRTIADIARSEGEDLASLEARLACLEVFALGGRSNQDDAADIGYYGLRLALAAPLAGTGNYIAQNGLRGGAGAPLLVDLIVCLSERFGVVVSQKAAAELVPVVGAFGGAFVNSLFMQHFQDMARAHFTVRRLERKYCPELIQAEYQRLLPLR